MIQKLTDIHAWLLRQDWQLRLFHLGFMLCLVSLLQLNAFQDVQVQGQEYAKPSFWEAAGLGISPMEQQVLWILGIGLFALFNLSLHFKSWRFDLLTQATPFLFINSNLAESILPISAIAIAQGNILLLSNTLFTNAARLSGDAHDKRFLQDAFAQYVNPILLKKLKDQPEMLDLGGEQREMTVLFADIRGFTSFAEHTPPKHMVRVLGLCLQAISEVILEHNGTIDKYLGDGVMAFWNAPVANHNHATDALEAAIAIQIRLKQLGRLYPECSHLRMGIGLHTGPMIVGNMGSEIRFDYTVLGDNVNLAARLEAATKDYGVDILLGETTLQQYRGHKLLFRCLGDAKVRGRKQAIRIYEPRLDTPENQLIFENYQTAKQHLENHQPQEALQILNRLSHIGDEASKKLLQQLQNSNDPNLSNTTPQTQPQIIHIQPKSNLQKIQG